MATVREDSIPHVVRTAHEQRLDGTWNAVISQIDQINSSIRLIRLGLVGEAVRTPIARFTTAPAGSTIPSIHPLPQIKAHPSPASTLQPTPSFACPSARPPKLIPSSPCPQPSRTHLPGQYIDLTIPTVPTVGGFTITSAPSTTRLSTPYIELAIQSSPNNPPAAYLWRPASTILNNPVSFRIGGAFVYPPAHYALEEVRAIDRAVFVAGGVGVNPIMSMLSAMDGAGEAVRGRIGGMPRCVRVLYSCRRGVAESDTAGHGQGKAEGVLFEQRLKALAEKWAGSKEVDYQYTFYETSGQGREGKGEGTNIRYEGSRVRHEDLFEALGPEGERKGTVVYVCGVPGMTDEFVEVLKRQPGMSERQVCCEKWW